MAKRTRKDEPAGPKPAVCRHHGGSLACPQCGACTGCRYCPGHPEPEPTSEPERSSAGESTGEDRPDPGTGYYPQEYSVTDPPGA